MKILLLGKAGMLGSCFYGAFQKKSDIELKAFDKDTLDITDYGV
ncbi:NAD(P)-dependent oxidoreductase, partial [Candidatus Peregrinibacteria bacterium]|nr:NAD(P)-dependent oxidoreductase [Candidatus Peregrinibacteria bacterium]